jgi:signal transduction histidine kinase
MISDMTSGSFTRMAIDFTADIEAVQRIDAVPRILEVVCRTTGMGFAAVARVTDERWVCCAVRDEIQFGLEPGGELELETTICHEIRQRQEAVAIDHVALDAVYAGHHTPALYGFQSYISMPITLSDGTIFGTLCAIDPRPARIDTPETVGMFKLFAELIAFQLDAAQRLATSEASLLSERQGSELREQFIAVLGHDLRNPLASIDAGASMLLNTPLNEKAQAIVGLLKTSVGRMSGLIDNVLDLARGRLGGGLSVDRNADAPLEPVLAQVVAELQSSSPDRVIVSDFALDCPVSCDRPRIAQLLSNLLGNALTYGAKDQPIRVAATTAGGLFTLTVANAGDAIAPDALERLFQPFTRGDDRPNRQGLGLGLYIASEVARAHAGELTVTSSEVETKFTFTMPLS